MAAFETDFIRIKEALDAARLVADNPSCNLNDINTLTNNKINTLTEISNEKDNTIVALEAGENTFVATSVEEIATVVPEPQNGYSCSIITEVDGVPSYDATYVYDADKTEWVKLLPGMNLDPSNVLSGIEYKADSGMKTGTLGDDITTSAALNKIGTIFKTLTEEYLNTPSNITAQELFTAINPGEGLSPLYRAVDWSKYNDFSNFMEGKTQITSLDLSWTKPITATSISGFCKNCSGLTKLDIRTITFDTNITTDVLLNVPNDCEIIVKDEDTKQLLLTINSNLTNITAIEGSEE